MMQSKGAKKFQFYFVSCNAHTILTAANSWRKVPLSGASTSIQFIPIPMQVHIRWVSSWIRLGWLVVWMTERTSSTPPLWHWEMTTFPMRNDEYNLTGSTQQQIPARKSKIFQPQKSEWENDWVDTLNSPKFSRNLKPSKRKWQYPPGKL